MHNEMNAAACADSPSVLAGDIACRTCIMNALCHTWPLSVRVETCRMCIMNAACSWGQSRRKIAAPYASARRSTERRMQAVAATLAFPGESAVPRRGSDGRAGGQLGRKACTPTRPSRGQRGHDWPRIPAAQSGCITSEAPARIHFVAGTFVRIGPAKTKVGPRTVVV